jgi:hypothetical protein
LNIIIRLDRNKWEEKLAVEHMLCTVRRRDKKPGFAETGTTTSGNTLEHYRRTWISQMAWEK